MPQRGLKFQLKSILKKQESCSSEERAGLLGGDAPLRIRSAVFPLGTGAQPSREPAATLPQRRPCLWLLCFLSMTLVALAVLGVVRHATHGEATPSPPMAPPPPDPFVVMKAKVLHSKRRSPPPSFESGSGTLPVEYL